MLDINKLIELAKKEDYQIAISKRNKPSQKGQGVNFYLEYTIYDELIYYHIQKNSPAIESSKTYLLAYGPSKSMSGRQDVYALALVGENLKAVAQEVKQLTDERSANCNTEFFVILKTRNLDVKSLETFANKTEKLGYTNYYDIARYLEGLVTNNKSLLDQKRHILDELRLDEAQQEVLKHILRSESAISEAKKLISNHIWTQSIEKALITCLKTATGYDHILANLHLLNTRTLENIFCLKTKAIKAKELMCLSDFLSKNDELKPYLKRYFQHYIFSSNNNAALLERYNELFGTNFTCESALLDSLSIEELAKFVGLTTSKISEYIKNSIKKHDFVDFINKVQNQPQLKSALHKQIKRWLADKVDLPRQKKSQLYKLNPSVFNGETLSSITKCNAQQIVKQLSGEARHDFLIKLSQSSIYFIDCLEGTNIEEHILIEFVESFLTNLSKCPAARIKKLASYAEINRFHQVTLVLELVGLLKQKEQLKPDHINNLVKDYAVNIRRDFINNRSLPKNVIDNRVLPPCTDTKRRNLTFCEGNACSDENGKNYYVCRRKRCNRFDMLYDSKSLFVNVLNHFKVDVQAWFESDVTAILSSLNRLYELKEKLVCKSCNKPLEPDDHDAAIADYAVGTTYWLCKNKTCADVYESVKITHCIGCRSPIDSRKQKHSCNPFELNVTKKFYICDTCGSCCGKHQTIGTCPKCGGEHAYDPNDERRKLKCKYCEETVSMTDATYKKLQDIKKDTDQHSYMYFSNNKLNVYKFSRRDKDKEPVLFLHSLSELLQIEVFSLWFNKNKPKTIFDMSLINELIHNGKYHQRYGNLEDKPSIIKELNKLAEDKSLSAEDFAESYRSLKNAGLLEHYQSIELPFIMALHSLLGDGIRVDIGKWEQKCKQLSKKRTELKERLKEQLEALGLNHVAELPNFRSIYKRVDLEQPHFIHDEYLKALSQSSDNEIYTTLYELKKMSRIRPVLNAVKLNKISPIYKTFGTVTGRCTAQKPAILNIPKDYRHFIGADSGHRIIESDYRQMEIGVLASLAKDEQLINDFNEIDVYSKFAENIIAANILENCTRDTAKMTVLGIIYGMKPKTVAQKLNLEPCIAESLIEKFFAIYPQTQSYLENQIEVGRSDGEVQSITGLKRYTKETVNPPSQSEKDWEENWFKNFPIQASAASVFKKSIINLEQDLQNKAAIKKYPYLHKGQFKLLVPHYDALVYQVKVESCDEFKGIVETAMIKAMTDLFPELKPRIEHTEGDEWQV